MLIDNSRRSLGSRLLLAAAVALIGGCGGSKPPPPETAPGDRALLESAQRPLQRAHEAEVMSGERKADLDQKLGESE
jgi:hypothetical protein